MKKKLLLFASLTALLTGCAGEFNKVFKSTDYDFRYEYAKQCFAQGKYSKAESLLIDLITLKKGTDDAQESLYMLAMSQFMSSNYDGAAETFKKYYQTYP